MPRELEGEIIHVMQVLSVAPPPTPTVVPYDSLPACESLCSTDEFIPGDDTRLRIVGGRCERKAATVTFDAQVALELRVERGGASQSCIIELDLNAGRNHFNLLNDGNLIASFSAPQLIARRRRYTFAIPVGQSHSAATISLVKRTEAGALQLWPYSSTLPVIVHGVRLSHGWRLVQPLASLRKVEVLGDSDAAGFGNEGPASLVSLRGLLAAQLRTQNASSAWPHVLGRLLGAEVRVVASSLPHRPSPYLASLTLPHLSSPSLAFSYHLRSPDQRGRVERRRRGRQRAEQPPRSHAG